MHYVTGAAIENDCVVLLLNFSLNRLSFFLGSQKCCALQHLYTCSTKPQPSTRSHPIAKDAICSAPSYHMHAHIQKLCRNAFSRDNMNC